MNEKHVLVILIQLIVLWIGVFDLEHLQREKTITLCSSRRGYPLLYEQANSLEMSAASKSLCGASLAVKKRCPGDGTDACALSSNFILQNSGCEHDF